MAIRIHEKLKIKMQIKIKIKMKMKIKIKNKYYDKDGVCVYAYVECVDKWMDG